MSKQSKWNDVEKQDEMWKNGDYDYLDESKASIKHYLAYYFTVKLVSEPYMVWDIGAGTGEFIDLIYEKFGHYTYNDISKTAANIFCRNYEDYLDTCSVITENILETNKDKYNVILLLGATRGLYSNEVVERIYSENLLNPGVFIIDHNHPLKPFLDNPDFSIQYTLRDMEYNIPAYNRKMEVYVKQ